ncbi:hypothetical protein MMC13_001907 [Lambiella insularis]|nr:hypothetical protein [Lambiella insularis]
MCFDTNAPLLLQLPSYLASTGYRSPNNESDTLSRHTFGKDYFEYLAAHPSKEANFASAMWIQEIFPAAGIPRYPFEQYLSPDQKPDLNVVSDADVGGGQGQWLDTALKDHPYLREHGHRLVLQDFPTVIDNIKRTDQRDDRAFELMAHDFFTPQPVIGERATAIFEASCTTGQTMMC